MSRLSQTNKVCTVRAHEQRPASFETGLNRFARLAEPARSWLDENAHARGGHRRGLPRHRARQALALENGRDAGGFAVSAEANKEFHDTSPCCGSHGAANVDWTGAARLMTRR